MTAHLSGVQETRGTGCRLVVRLPPGPLVGLDGARLIVAAAAEADPALAAETARQRPAEWNVLLRGRCPNAMPLASVASTCSERRLHAESEQVMRVVDAVAVLITRLAAKQPVELVIEGAARIDLPSLRGLLRIADRARAAHAAVDVVLAGATPEPGSPGGAGEDEAVAKVRALAWDAFWRRCSECAAPPVLAAPGPADDGRPSGQAAVFPPPLERAFFARASHGASAEERLAGALLAMRASFFTTSYDVGLAASHLGLRELADHEPDMDTVRDLVQNAPATDDPASVGIGPDDVIDAGAVRSLLHRYRGMTHVFVLDYGAALAEFAVAVEATRVPHVRARARLLRALLNIKRIGDIGTGMRDASDGLAELAADDGGADDKATTNAVEAAWLYNVRALGHLQRRDLRSAHADERAATRLVGKLSTTDATHLKVNLVSNLSVIAEYSGDLDQALALWRWFAKHGTGWGDVFAKHHAYREGGLLAKAGRIAEGGSLLARSHDRAVASGDQFHALAVALELGALMLDHGDRRAAASWYATASRNAAEFGDPYHQSLALAGEAISSGGLSSRQAKRLADRATEAVGYPAPARALSRALSSGDATEVGRLLPRARTKLNRPFFPVRLEFGASDEQHSSNVARP
jgi:hypothetical protein